jgi:hypothetical protein
LCEYWDDRHFQDILEKDRFLQDRDSMKRKLDLSSGHTFFVSEVSSISSRNSITVLKRLLRFLPSHSYLHKRILWTTRYLKEDEKVLIRSLKQKHISL